MENNAPLSYGLKCVLEYLDVNKRCQLVRRFGSLNEQHEIVPMTAINVTMESSELIVNHFQHLFKFAVIPEGETSDSFVKKVFEDPSTIWKSELEDSLPEGGKEFIKYYILSNPTEHTVQVWRLPETSNLPQLVSRLLCKYFEGKNTKITEALEFGWGFNELAAVLTEELKFTARRIKIKPGVDPIPVLRFLKDSCLPLTELTVTAFNETHSVFANDVLMQAEVLNIDNTNPIRAWYNLLKRLSNRTINVLNVLVPFNFTPVYQDWKANPRPIGVKFTVGIIYGHDSVSDLLRFYSEQYSASHKKAIILSKTNPQFEYSLTMPTGDDSEFNIYGETDPERIVLESMPRGSAVLLEEPEI